MLEREKEAPAVLAPHFEGVCSDQKQLSLAFQDPS